VARDWARPVVHWEIESTDPERQRAFYADLFNWARVATSAGASAPA